MKNAILITSTVCAIAMMLFINMGTKRINQSQDDAFVPVKEWFDDIEAQHESMIADEEAKEAAKLQFSERMKELSRQQESVYTDLVRGSTAASQGSPATGTTGAEQNVADADAATSLNTLVRRQTKIIDDFKQLSYDLRQHLQGIADYRHIEAMNDIRDSNAASHLESLKTKLTRKQPDAAESAKTWADKMNGWAVQLQVD